jgi:hypothetical protein
VLALLPLHPWPFCSIFERERRAGNIPPLCISHCFTRSIALREIRSWWGLWCRLRALCGLCVLRGVQDSASATKGSPPASWRWPTVATVRLSPMNPTHQRASIS